MQGTVVEGRAAIPQGNDVTEILTQGTDQGGPALLVAEGKMMMMMILTLTGDAVTAPDPLEPMLDREDEMYSSNSLLICQCTVSLSYCIPQCSLPRICFYIGFLVEICLCFRPLDNVVMRYGEHGHAARLMVLLVINGMIIFFSLVFFFIISVLFAIKWYSCLIDWIQDDKLLGMKWQEKYFAIRYVNIIYLLIELS